MQKVIFQLRSISFLILIFLAFSSVCKLQLRRNQFRVSEETITRGAILRNIRSRLLRAAKVYLIKINLTDPYIKIDVLYGIDGKLVESICGKMALENGAIAAINGDFLIWPQEAFWPHSERRGVGHYSYYHHGSLSGFALTPKGASYFTLFLSRFHYCGKWARISSGFHK